MIKKQFWNDEGEQRIHLVGEYVGVCWNFDWVGDPSGKIRKVRENHPYINAWRIYEIDKNGVADVDEDGPLDGGMSLEFAEQIHKELGRAIAYLKEVIHE